MKKEDLLDKINKMIYSKNKRSRNELEELLIIREGIKSLKEENDGDDKGNSGLLKAFTAFINLFT